MDEVLRFPLLRLPKNGLLHAFQLMCLAQVFGISLLSTKSKNAITSSELYLRVKKEIIVEVTYAFEIYIEFAHRSSLSILLYSVVRGQPLQELRIPESLVVTGNARGWQGFRNLGNLSVKQFIDHLKTIYHWNHVLLKIGLYAQRYDLSSVCKIVTNADTTWLNNASHELNQRVLEKIPTGKLILEEDALQNRRIPKMALVQSFDEIQVMAPEIRLSLDEMLLMNSKAIVLVYANISGQDANRFLKLWMAGSNSSMEELAIELAEDVFISEQTILNGLGSQAGTEIGYFKMSHSKRKNRIPPGKDIIRRDGTRATIHFQTINHIPTFRMVVWHDHCIAQETDP